MSAMVANLGTLELVLRREGGVREIEGRWHVPDLGGAGYGGG
jgi:hypothetical protein